MAIKRMSEATVRKRGRFPNMAANIFFRGGVQYLVIAGGGGGGKSHVGGVNGIGSGGAGGYRSNVVGENSGGNSSPEAARDVVVGNTFTISIGAGGIQGAQGSNTNGSNSTFDDITSTGGGRGGWVWGPGSNGGSGGAGSPHGNAGSGIAGQGTDGAGQNSGGGSKTSGNAGGSGTSSAITGTAITRARGGRVDQTDGATANSGDGGSGVRSGGNARNGASGVVILQYPEGANLDIGPGLTYSTSEIGNGLKQTTFTAGTDTVTVT